MTYGEIHDQEPGPAGAADFGELALRLAELGRDLHSRGWVLGTSGNFSAVISLDPLRLAISASGVDKGSLGPHQILQVDERGNAIEGSARPSAETMLHIAVIRLRRARAVLHTHSVWSTMLSDAYGKQRGIEIKGYEMLKGLDGVNTHEHSEWLPIIENCQDSARLVDGIEDELNRHPNSHGFLLQRHGLYTWGSDLATAKRHVEILEFLLEVMGRKVSPS
jgi:methylthioribulose-1-phosphate dehydratase